MSTASVIESIEVVSQRALILDCEMTLYTVSWTTVDGAHVSHAASPKSVKGLALPDQVVMITYVTDRVGADDLLTLGVVTVSLDSVGIARATLTISGATFPIPIYVRSGLS